MFVRTMLLILLGAALVAWYIRWRTLVVRARWRHENAERCARWSHEEAEPQVAEE
jgi:hypothetical protein